MLIFGVLSAHSSLANEYSIKKQITEVEKTISIAEKEKNYKVAIEGLERLSTLIPTNTSFLFRKAVYLILSKDYADAEIILEKLAEHTNDVRVFKYLALCQSNLGKSKKAFETLYKLEKLDPHSISKFESK